jgi:hypothetical protein
MTTSLYESALDLNPSLFLMLLSSFWSPSCQTHIFLPCFTSQKKGVLFWDSIDFKHWMSYLFMQSGSPGVVPHFERELAGHLIGSHLKEQRLNLWWSYMKQVGFQYIPVSSYNKSLPNYVY